MEEKVIHSTNIRDRIQNLELVINELVRECRARVDSYSDPLAESLLETTAKVLEGLGEAFHAYHISNRPTPEDQTDLTKSSDPWD